MTASIDHTGRWLTDANGRVVILHGVNMVNKLHPYDPASAGFGADDASFLARHGFNTVRLGIIWKALEPEPGSYDERYLDSLAATVAELGREGIFVLLDFHQDMLNERFNGEGFPDWAVEDDGIRARPDIGFPGNYVVMRALWRAYDHFWANDPGAGGVGLQDRYAAAWAKVADRFRGNQAVFAYDIFNEPFPGSSAAACARPGGSSSFDEKLTAFTRRVFAAIRAVDQDKLLFYEPNVLFDYGSRSHHGDTGDPRAGLSFHAYCLAAPPDLPHVRGRLQDAFCLRQEQRVFRNAELQAARFGDTLVLSEFGATDDLQAVERAADLADRYMVSWQYWAYWNRDPCCARPEEGLVHRLGEPPRGSNVKQAKLDVLSRPFPRAVAGTPERFRFDRAERVFELSYATRAPGGDFLAPEVETEVYVPERHFPSGYEVEVRGAAVVSEPGTSHLRLVNGAGVERVELRVDPA